MPLELAVATTGHNLDCAFYEYLDASLATAMSGAIVLAGWAPFPWGQLGTGPVPPSLEALEGLGVNGEALDQSILVLFKIDDMYPHMFRKGGKLWPVVRIAFATLLMYYRERVQTLTAGPYKAEGRPVIVELKRVMASEYGLGESAHSTLLGWSDAISERFKAENLDLTQRNKDTVAKEVAAAVSNLARSVAQQGLQMQAMLATQQELVQKFSAMQQQLTAVQQQLASGPSGSAQTPDAADRSAGRSPGSARRTTPMRAAAAAANAATANSPTNLGDEQAGPCEP